MPTFAAGSRCKDKPGCLASAVINVLDCWCQKGYPDAATGAGKVCLAGQSCNTALAEGSQCVTNVCLTTIYQKVTYACKCGDTTPDTCAIGTYCQKTFAAGSRCKAKPGCLALKATNVESCWCQVGYPSAPTGAGKECAVGQSCDTALTEGNQCTAPVCATTIYQKVTASCKCGVATPDTCAIDK